MDSPQTNLTLGAAMNFVEIEIVIWSSTRSGDRHPFPIGIDNDLHVTQIGNGIERSFRQRPNPADNTEYGQNDDQELNAFRALASIMRSRKAANGLRLISDVDGRVSIGIALPGFQSALNFRFGINQEIGAGDNTFVFASKPALTS